MDIEKYREAFSVINQYTKVTKFRNFQYRLLLGKIILNVDLYDWNLIVSNCCTFCESDLEDTFHLFYLCHKVKPLIDLFYELCFSSGLDVTRNILDFLFNTVVNPKYHIINFLCIYVKQFIYKNRCQNKRISVQKFMVELELHQKIEYEIAKQELKVHKHVKRWSPIFYFPENIATQENII